MSPRFVLFKRGRVWYVRYAGETTFHSTGFTNQKEAAAFAQREVDKDGPAPAENTSPDLSLKVQENDRKQAYLLKKRGSMWYVRFADERTFHSTNSRSRYDAERYAHKASERRKRSRSPDVTLNEFACDFFKWDICKWVKRQHEKDHSFSEPVAQNRRGHLGNHILPQFGSMQLSEISAYDVEDWLISLPLANQTRNHILYSFRIVMEEAAYQGLIPNNPIKQIRPMGKKYTPCGGNRSCLTSRG